MVIDMGWGAAPEGAGPVEKSISAFPDMAAWQGSMKKLGVRPGIWVRPLLSVDAKLPAAWHLPPTSSADR